MTISVYSKNVDMFSCCIARFGMLYCYQESLTTTIGTSKESKTSKKFKEYNDMLKYHFMLT